MSVSGALSRAAGAAWRMPAQGVLAFFRPGNKLSRFASSAKSVDKLIKTAKASADLTSGILSCQEGASASCATAKRVSAAMGDARSVIALTNVLRGAIPSCVASVKACYGRMARCMDVEERGRRRLHAVVAFKELCNVVTTTTFITTFGALRPVLFANKMSDHPFLDSQTKQAMTHSVVGIMAAGHASAMFGAFASLYIGRVEYAQEKRNLWGEEGEFIKDQLMQKHREQVLSAILVIFEKAFELGSDIIKLAPLGLSAGVQLASSSACVLAACCVGLYSSWRKA